jgi:hypothetical protein
MFKNLIYTYKCDGSGSTKLKIIAYGSEQRHHLDARFLSQVYLVLNSVLICRELLVSMCLQLKHKLSLCWMRFSC